MRILALSPWADLEAKARPFAAEPHAVLRTPETGLVMLRGRISGDGTAFNLGEATVTRCSVQTAAGHEGHAYVLGRNHRHAHTAALLDGLMQDETRSQTIATQVIEPLERRIADRCEKAARQAAATRVEFFTLVRGEND